MITNRFRQLPLGAVEAQGFLKNILELQKAGMTGHMEDYPDYGKDSGWLGGDGESWERGPYYVRGLVALAYAMKDEELIKKAYKWIDWALDSQRENGNFGPLVMEREWWAKMPMLMAIRDYYCAEIHIRSCNDAENHRQSHNEIYKDDARILNFFEKYFSFQIKNLPSNPLDSWAKARGGDNVEVVLWYYDEIKSLKGEEKNWLRELASLLIEQTEDWTDIFQNTGVRHHVVNTTQAMKTPYLKYIITKDIKCRDALKAGLDNIRNDHGRIDNLPNADEAARDNLHTRGTESCAVVEGMLSMEICGAVTGETYIYDNLESYCYNSLPNAFTYDLRMHTYYQMQNEVMATQGFHGFDCDHGDSSAFGAPCGFDCCFSNSHMGYPKFVQNMWLKDDEGLVAVCYGPNSVEITEDGRKISFRQETNYPFDDEVKFIYTGDASEICLKLRIPGWSRNSSVSGAGDRAVTDDGEYIRIKGEFEAGDTISVNFYSEIEVRDWHHGGRYVKKGVLLYCLPIKEEYRFSKTNDYKEIKYVCHDGAFNTEIFPAGRWNYALYEDGMVYEQIKSVITGQPFSPDGAPCVIKAKGQIAGDWILSGNKAGIFDPAGVPQDESKTEDIALIPYGATRLRISVFPKAVKNTCGDRKTEAFDIGAETAFESIFVNYSRYKDCRKYVILYGKESGKYDSTVYDVEFNGYKGGGHMFERDKFAFTVNDKGVYYIKMLAVSEGNAIAESNEIKVIMK